MIRSGLLRPRVVHLKLDKETHLNFKTRLLAHGLSMQEAFEEFARLVGAANPSAVRMLERLVMLRVRAELAEMGVKPSLGKRSRSKKVDELDHDVLYGLINEEGADVNEDEQPPPTGGRGEAA